MLQTFGPQPRLKTTNKKGTVFPATEICLVGSSKFLANKMYEAICSLCLAEAKGYAFTGMEDSFPRKRWVLRSGRKRKKPAESTDAGSSAGCLSQALLIPHFS